MTLDQHHPTRHHGPVAFNSATGLGGPNSKADSRLFAAIFTSVRNTIGAPSMSSHGGRAFGLAGSLLPVRQSCHVLGTPLGGGMLSFTLSKEASMPGIVTRISRALFSRSAPVSIIRPASSLADARRLAAELIATGARVRIAPAAQGFDVEVLA